MVGERDNILKEHNKAFILGTYTQGRLQSLHSGCRLSDLV